MAGTLGDIFVNLQMPTPALTGGSPAVNPTTGLLSNGNGSVDLTASQSTAANNIGLGANTSGKTAQDSRQHPYYRSEWMQRIANLTTVRTHQYAVWITIGYFEVLQGGDAPWPATSTRSAVLTTSLARRWAS